MVQVDPVKVESKKNTSRLLGNMLFSHLAKAKTLLEKDSTVSIPTCDPLQLIQRRSEIVQKIEQKLTADHDQQLTEL